MLPMIDDSVDHRVSWNTVGRGYVRVVLMKDHDTRLRAAHVGPAKRAASSLFVREEEWG